MFILIQRKEFFLMHCRKTADYFSQKKSIYKMSLPIYYKRIAYGFSKDFGMRHPHFYLFRHK